MKRPPRRASAARGFEKSAVRAAAVVPVELVEVPDAPHELVFEPDVNASVDRIVRYCADVSAAA